ncbi:hypothetical protein SELR_13930 [Selenomonas ruminantium subsp. lactilytica TAM6421]|uniref:Uncharacterized protein n=1 Tax=Selenomonas ruminantium subsp. lactilytica (strain NBRC 103574 / TAM6421) TaxID=927704 RepID=I0GQR4_SELRL|nr:hypothetical protein SELR_13930 [Selenomonas ruminantium subsp. lactilytica TAM6421]
MEQNTSANQTMDMTEEELDKAIQSSLQEESARLYISPTLNQLPEKDRPPKELPCAYCFNAIWMRTTEILECYCRLTMQSAWNSQEPSALIQCDGTSVGVPEEK